MDGVIIVFFLANTSTGAIDHTNTTKMSGKTSNTRKTEPRKRHREVITSSSEDGGFDRPPVQEQTRKKRRNKAGPATTLQQPEQLFAKCLTTARMPIAALTTKWSLGENRPEDPRHVQRLKKRFLDEGRPKREAKGNHVVALCSGADVRRMMGKIGVNETDFSTTEVMPDFSDWMSINGGRKAELVEGQHRIKALSEFAEKVGWGEEEMWWPCEFYDRGESSRQTNKQASKQASARVTRGRKQIPC